MEGFIHTYKRVRQVIYIVAAVLTFLFFLMTLTNVIARYAFNAPILVGDEIAFYLFAYFAILGVYYGYGAKAHISVDLVTSKFSERTRAWLGVITAIFEQVVWLLILWQGSFVAFDLVTRTHILHAYTLAIPVVITFVVVPITAIIILIENTLSGIIPTVEQLRRK
jgi:TRAP-type C4-dicarboxylate transport system permease small subunit